MTHPHDTATPSVSVESECCPKLGCGAQKIVGRPCHDWDCPQQTLSAKEHIAAAPAPDTSPAAKSGEAASDRFECEYDEDTYTVTWPDGRWLIVSEDGTLTYGKSPSSQDFPAVRTSLAALSTPSPQPADAVREALLRYTKHLMICEQTLLPYKGRPCTCGLDDLIALSTPTEGAASQTEGMGGDAVRKLANEVEALKAFEDDIRDAIGNTNWSALMQRLAEARAALTPPETAEAVPVARLREALEEAALWHDAQDKAISKQPNANAGQNGWMRNEHQEQAQALRAAARSASSQGGE